MSPRFVILDHKSPKGDHWDLMLENGETLTTWAVPPQPQTYGAGDAFECFAEPLPDHRLAYLDYEGPVSGDRGTVRRIDTGTYRTLQPGHYRLFGRLFAGTLTVEETPDFRTIIRFAPSF